MHVTGGGSQVKSQAPHKKLWIWSAQPRPLAMAPKKKPSAQKALTSAGFWPLLPKLAVAIGKFVSVPGKFWEGCPSTLVKVAL